MRGAVEDEIFGDAEKPFFHELLLDLIVDEGAIKGVARFGEGDGSCDHFLGQHVDRVDDLFGGGAVDLLGSAEGVFDGGGDLHRVEADELSVGADDLQIEGGVFPQGFVLVAVDDVVSGDIVVARFHQAHFDTGPGSLRQSAMRLSRPAQTGRR